MVLARLARAKRHFRGFVCRRNVWPLVIGNVSTFVGSLGCAVVPGVYFADRVGDDFGAEGRRVVAGSRTQTAVCAVAGPRIDSDGDAHFDFGAETNVDAGHKTIGTARAGWSSESLMVAAASRFDLVSYLKRNDGTQLELAKC